MVGEKMSRIFFISNPPEVNGRLEAKSFWFRRKTYGWASLPSRSFGSWQGWTPSSWQGWLTLVLYILFLVSKFLVINSYSHSESDTLTVFSVPFIIATIVLILVCSHKGEKPKWQWGEEKERINDITK